MVGIVGCKLFAESVGVMLFDDAIEHLVNVEYPK